MTFSGGELLVQAIKEQGIDVAFGLVGNQISPILVHMKKYGLKFIGVRHEQAAVHMADGWAQIKRQCGIAMVSGGPGFSNSINGIVKAYMAETPILIIVGSVVTEQKDKGALQDMDQLSMVRQYCKWCATVHDTKRIKEYIARGIEVAYKGRRGPVVLEIPISILRREIESPESIQCIRNYENYLVNYVPSEAFAEVVDVLANADKPIVLVGDEAYYSKAEVLLNEFVEIAKIPVFTINKARGLISDDKSYCYGLGRVLEAGPQIYALSQADTILCIGVNKDYQMSSFDKPVFNENQTFIFITESNDKYTYINCKKFLEIVGSINVCLKGLIDAYKEKNIAMNKSQWVKVLDENTEKFWTELYKENYSETSLINPMKLIQGIQAEIEKDTIIVLDGSNAMFWGSLLFKATEIGQIIIAPDGTHGSMGCGLPLALGAKVAAPEKRVLLYTGDGSIGFNMMEIDTSIKYEIPITIVIHNDAAWGLCKTTQEVLYNDVYAADIGMVYYDKVTEALGGHGFLLEKQEDMLEILNKAMKLEKTVCINAMVDKNSYSPGLKWFNEVLRSMK
ncbi:thiamine pyrophosphate-binding protein [Ruminiclostridium herbifermentans]|uniref:Thiamine pyrophosphate-binding protein n=1 Tax=Ruminiclostridium herbifermentans TaxID=2488810 RepID=A0A4V6EPX1_9FIRM|nr:thiamine pyrophosphate-binding protein [Ruminiclostridium herbifermentans]QNU66249.1 thiamine pyrophosphate-binding protein [Ruminiclostridium herbifermentans]